MDLAEGQVLSHFYKSQTNKRLNEIECASIFKQVVEAIGYCHRNGIFHRDIKPENVLIDKYRRIKLIDFGFSVKSTASTKLTLFCGTPNYMSPEIILKREYLGGPSDVWALGVMLFVLTCGYFPFKGKDDKELHKKIVNVSVSFPPHASEELTGIISSMLKFNPASRPTCEQVLAHSWFQKAK